VFSSAVLLVASGVAAPSFAEVTFAEVEAALAALEAVDPGSVQPVIVPLVTLPDADVIDPVAAPVADPTELPDAISVPQVRTSGGGRMVGGYEFLPILSDQSCPRRIAEIGAEAEKLYDVATRTETEALRLRARFDALEEQNRTYELDDAILECPSGFVQDIQDLLDDLSDFELSVLVQEAETLSVCAQEGSQLINSRMTDLAASTEASAARDREALGGVLERWAAADARVSQAVSTFVFYDQRRTRLERATNDILRRCELLDGY
jgi:hypothetical protein